MRKALLPLFALILSLTFFAEVSANNKISEPVLTGNDSLIYLSNGSSSEPMILRKDNNIISMIPKTAKPVLPSDNGIALDVPANDDCANAESIGETSNVPFSTIDATSDGPLDFITAPNVWFLYTASITAPVQIVVSDTGSEYQTNMMRCAVYEGSTCPEAVEFPTPVELPGGETIETAVEIASLPAAVTGDITGYDQDYEFSSCICYYYGNGEFGDAVYSYTAETNDSINVYLDSGTSSSYTPFIVITDADGSELACNKINWYQARILNFPVTAGETYYIVVGNSYGYPSNDEYTLRISAPNYVFTISMDASVDVSRTTLDAIAGRQYFIEIGAHPYSDDVDCEGYLSIIPNPVVPANDECENATQGGILQLGSTIQFTGDNTGAPTIDCPQINVVPEVWVSFETEDTMDIALDLCGTAETFHSSYLYLTGGCPCDPYSKITYNTMSYLERCLSTQLRIFFTDVPPGTYWFPICSMYLSEGEYVCNVRSLTPQLCSDSSIYGQVPPDFRNNSSFIQSNILTNDAIADDFSDLDNTVSKITWWGDFYSANSSCDSDSVPFQIIFCDDDDGAPGDTVASYDVYASREETGYIYNTRTPQFKFIAKLNSSVSLTDGWLIIRGNSEDSCIFTWQTNTLTDGYSKIYNESTQHWTSSSYDFSFCLELGDAVSIEDDPASIPSTFELLQNCPNPFNAKTEIRYSLPVDSYINMEIYNVLGQKIIMLADEKQTAGYHSLIWDGTNESGQVVSSGMYFYKLTANEDTFIKKMIMLK